MLSGVEDAGRAEFGTGYPGYTTSPTGKEALRKGHGNYSSVGPKIYIQLFNILQCE